MIHVTRDSTLSLEDIRDTIVTIEEYVKGLTFEQKYGKED